MNLRGQLIGLLRVRNEELIIEDTINHMASFCKKIYVYDDASADSTADICMAHPAVTKVYCNHLWNENQTEVQSQQRMELFEAAKKGNRDSYFIYMDGDERIEWDFEIHDRVPSIAMKLFNAIITFDDQEDYKAGQLYNFRKYFDPAYRVIPMIFRDTAYYSGKIACERYPQNIGTPLVAGYVQHYGRAVSKQQFLDSCRHYQMYVPAFSEKWKNEEKIGAVRSKKGLITWEKCLSM